MRARRWPAAAAALLLVAGGGLLWWRSRAATAAASGPPVQTAAVVRRTITSSTTATGTVLAWQETIVRAGPAVSGTVEPFTWTISQPVSRGQVLFHLVNPQLDQQLQADRSNLRIAQLQLQALQAADGGAAPQAASARSARLNVAAAQANLAQAQRDLAAGQQVVAPGAGVVGTLAVAVGDTVGAGAPVASVLATGDLLAVVGAPAAEVDQIRPGAVADVFADGVSQAGRVVSVTPTPSAGGGRQGDATYPVAIRLPNPGGWLPGMAAMATIRYGSEWLTGLSGQLQAGASVAAVSQAAGVVTAVLVRPGSAVGDGQVLARIDPPQLADAAAAAARALAAARATLAQALTAQAAAAVAAPFTLGEAEARVAALQGAVASEQRSQAALTVRSPVAGVISGVEAVAGEPVSPGTPLLTVGDYSRLLVSFPLDQLYVNRVHVGQAATVSATAAPGRTFAGRVFLLAPEGNDVNGVATFQAEVLIDGPQASLRPGMAVAVTITLGRARDALTVPLQALRTDAAGAAYVVVLGPDGALQRVPVSVGLGDQLDAQVKGDLRAGERVVTSSLGAAQQGGGLNLRGRVLRRKPAVAHRAPPNRGR